MSHGTRSALPWLLALFLGLRLLFLTADPPAELVSHYQDFAFSVFDEGWWTGNARSAVLYGTPLGTGFDLFWVSPVYTALAAAAFAIGGPGLAAGRLVSIAMGVASVLLFWRIGRQRDDDAGGRCATLATFLFVIAFAPAQLLRLSTPESSGIAFGLAGVTALLSPRPWGAFAAGVFGALAMLVKPHFGVLVPAFAAASVALALRRGRPPVRELGADLTGAAAPLAIWAGWVTAHAREAEEIASFYLVDRWFAGVPAGLSGLVALVKPAAQVAIAGVVYRHHLFSWLPFLFVGAVIAAPRVWSAVARPRAASGVSDAALVFGLWALFGGAAISALPFQPLRYYLPALPPIVYLAAWTLTRPPRAATGGDAPAVRLLRWGAGALLATQLAFAAIASWLPARLAERAIGRVALLDPPELRITSFLLELVRTRSFTPFATLPREHAHVAALALCGAIALVTGGIVALAAARPFARGFLSLERVAAHSRWILAAILAFHAVAWIRWEPAHTLPAMAREIDRLVPEDAVVSPSGTFSLDSRRRYDASAVARGAMFDAEGADYFIVLAAHPRIGALPEGEIERRHPESARVAVFELTGDYVYHLYRSRASGSERRVGFSASP